MRRGRPSRGRVCAGCRHVHISAGDTYGYNRGDSTRPRSMGIVMIGLSKSGPSVAALPAPDVDRTYRRERRRVFVGIFAGYAAYYLVRNNLALAIPDILAENPEYTKADLGWALTGTSIAYGVSKFLMGSVSDRSNPRYFLPLGLLISCAIIFASGIFKAMYASLALVIVLQIANGWVQGMGWPPCGKS